ncbi:hypothetical protein BDQ12DRAFT_674325 [Crucibulum laeve]|uniref:Uncharacterized protein n=1 Tax=Crucibulum laeve TaxID=68775 RepID=A0A5C3MCB7_9AGAR|nr:hypothetical protein BDQ12DRAFT_674325 [Crucibulum laeve]
MRRRLSTIAHLTRPILNQGRVGTKGIPYRRFNTTLATDIPPEYPYESVTLAESIPPSSTEPTHLPTAEVLKAAHQIALICVEKRNVTSARQILAYVESGGISGDRSVTITHRLTPHVVLHTFLRLGMVEEAQRLCHELLEQDRFPIHQKTLEAVMRALLVSEPSPENRPTKLVYHVGGKGGNHVLSPIACKNRHGTLALRLLSDKGAVGRRTDAMFDMFIEHSLQNGEVIAASQAFVYLARHWKIKESLNTHLDVILQDKTQAPAAKAMYIEERDKLNSESLYPSFDYMKKILDVIEGALQEYETNMQDKDSLRAALQALANLAGLLERDEIPFPWLSRLINVLDRCPKGPSYVLVTSQQTGEKEVANVYFRRVLDGFIRSLPTTQPIAPSPFHNQPSEGVQRAENEGMLPPIDRYAYAALVEYALCNKRSQPLAEQILTHMTQKRSEPLDPNFYQMKRAIFTGVGTLHNPTVAQDLCRNYSIGSITQYRHYDELLTTALSSPPGSRYIQSVTGYIAVVVRVHPGLVSKIIYKLLPGLRSSELKRRPEQSLEDFTRYCSQQRAKTLEKLSKLGPHFFAILINGLSRTGQPELVEWVWRASRQAESMRLKKTEGGEWTNPWVLPLNAYMNVIRCYAAEARKPAVVTPLDRKFKVSPEQLEEKHVGPWTCYRLKHRALVQEAQLEGDALQQKLQQLRLESMVNACRAVYISLKSMQTRELPPVVHAPVLDEPLCELMLEFLSELPVVEGWDARPSIVKMVAEVQEDLAEVRERNRKQKAQDSVKIVEGEEKTEKTVVEGTGKVQENLEDRPEVSEKPRVLASE